MIPKGINNEKIYPDQEACLAIWKELGTPKDALVVGRWDVSTLLRITI